MLLAVNLNAIIYIHGARLLLLVLLSFCFSNAKVVGPMVQETAKCKSSCTVGIDRIEKTCWVFLQPGFMADCELFCVYAHA